MLNIGQINLAKNTTARDDIGGKFAQGELDIAMVQEPCINYHEIKGARMSEIPGTIAIYCAKTRCKPAARAGIYICKKWANSVNYILLDQFTDRDMATVLTEIKIGNRKLKVIFCSLYSPSLLANGTTSNDPVTPILRRLATHATATRSKLILGADINARNVWWGSDITNPRGAIFEEFCRVDAGLQILNRGRIPTFNRTGDNAAESVIDVTLVSESFETSIVNWHVHSDITGSDHRLIKMEMPQIRQEEQIVYGRRKTNWKKYAKITKTKLLAFLNNHAQFETKQELNFGAEKLGELLRQTHMQCSNKQKIKNKYYREWFTDELQEKRKAILRCRTKIRRLKERNAVPELAIAVINYKQKQREYKANCDKAYSNQWKSKMSQLEGIRDTARIQKLIERNISKSINTLSKNDGTFTNNREETVDLLMETHFPGCIKSVYVPDESNQMANELQQSETEEVIPTDDLNRLISLQSVASAIASFEPFKAPGKDNIFPALLQKADELVLEALNRLFKASIKLSHIPNEWCGTLVTFIPKIGKASYEDPKAFRPISLMSFVLKTLEKIVNTHLKDEVRLIDKLSPHQHAYRPGRGTATALDEVATILQQCLDEKGKALVLFSDVSGAFDRTSFAVTLEALRKKDVKGWTVSWIAQMLKSRKMIANLQGKDPTHFFVPVTGLAQGGIVSPLAWSCAIDILIRRLTAKGFKATCYADDLTIICTLKHGQPDHLATEMTKAIAILERWCAETGLSFSTDKMKLMEVNKGRTEILRSNSLRFRNVPIVKVKTYKLLGVYIDSKLDWNTHIDKCIEKGRQSLFVTGHFIKFNWGAKPKVSMAVYLQIVLPRMLYACYVWWHRAQQVSNARKFEKIQRLALRMCLGVYLTTPKADMDFIAGISSIALQTKKLALMECSRLHSNGLLIMQNCSIGHRQINLTRKRLTPSGETDLIPLSSNTRRNFDTTIASRAQWNTGVPMEESDSWYSDGSKCDERVGSGLCNLNKGIRKSYRLSNHGTIMQAELFGIQKCAEQYSSNTTGKNIYIMSDSQAAIKAISKDTINSLSVQRCVKILRELSVRNRVTIVWVPAHSNHLGNEEADALAKLGTNKQTIDKEVPNSRSIFKNAVEEWFETERRIEWRERFTTRGSYGCSMIPRMNLKTSREMWNLNRGQIRAAVSIMTGHARLNRDKNRANPDESPLCRYCEDEEETVKHIYMHCDQLDELRVRYFGKYSLEYHELGEYDLSVFINFAKDASFYQELSCHKPEVRDG